MNVSISLRLSHAAPSLATHRILTDAELPRRDNPRPALPMVFYFANETMVINRDWQMYLLYINSGMTPSNVAALMDTGRAFCNNMGTGAPDNRRDWIRGENLTAEDPKFSRVFTCGDARVQMVGSLVTMMDGNKPPDYSITPRTHPHLFFAAVTTGDDGTPHSFPHGATYPWYKGGLVSVTFMPHVSCVPVSYPVPAAQRTENSPTLARI